MNGFLREEFIKLYETPVLNQVYEKLKLRGFQRSDGLSPPPDVGELDIKCVKESQYFFS